MDLRPDFLLHPVTEADLIVANVSAKGSVVAFPCMFLLPEVLNGRHPGIGRFEHLSYYDPEQTQKSSNRQINHQH
jgi:hypothetical protein